MPDEDAQPTGALGKAKTFAKRFLAVAAAVAAIWGAVKAVDEAHNWYVNWQADRHPSELERTPNLGLQFMQSGKQDNLSLQDADTPIVRVQLKRRPFELRCPKLKDGEALQVTAWTDKSIFTVHDGDKTDDIPFLAGGTGMADYDYGSGRLALNNKANNYLIGTRTAHVSASQDKVYVASFDRPYYLPNPGKTPLVKQKTDVFLTVFVDHNHDKVADVGEFEFVQLDF